MGVETGNSSFDQFVENEVAQVVLRHPAEVQREQSFLHDQGHEDVEGQLFVFEEAEQAGCNVVHSLTVADFREHEGYSLEHVEKLFGLLLGERGICLGVLRALQVDQNLVLEPLVQGFFL